jgi:YD repeat-containing protein
MKNGAYKVVIKNNNEYWYDSNGNMIHYKHSNGYEWWKEFDSNGKVIHIKDSNGLEAWYEYDSNGNEIHYKHSNGYECWFDSNGNKITKEEFDRIHSSCDGKVVTIEGKSYQLKEILKNS